MSPGSCKRPRWRPGSAATFRGRAQTRLFRPFAARGLASSAQIEEAHVQRHLGHASAEMTRRYQRKRDRFKVNLTKAAGL